MLPSLNAIAVPEAFVNDCARCAITARSSELPRLLVLLPASETCVAMVCAVLKELLQNVWARMSSVARHQYQRLN
jgi:hypothetical protein